MRDETKTKAQLIRELQAVRQQVAILQTAEPNRKPAAGALDPGPNGLATMRELAVAPAQTNDELALFRKFFDASPVGFGMSDLDGRIAYGNQALCRLFGAGRPEDAIGTSIFSYYDSDYAEMRRSQVIPTLLRDGIWLSDLTIKLRDGKRIQALQSTFLIRDDAGNPVRIAVVMSDITQRKLAEEGLQQSHNELRAIYDSMFDGLLIADSETTHLLKANASICRMLGYTEAEMLSLSVKDLHPPDLVPQILERIRARSEGRFAGHVDSRMLHKDGSIRYVDVVGSPLIFGGRPCVASFFRDVTERKGAELALERERRTLKHMLRASDHERQLIAYDIHDGLAQQLTGAIMQFQSYDHLRTAEPREARQAFDGGLSLLRQAHAKARRLISGVRPPILDESGVVAAIAHLVHDPAFERGPRIDFRSRVTFQRLAPVVENVVYRIVQEGLTNARHHSQSPEIRVSLLQRDDRLRIKIQDWGVGFDPATVHENRFGLEGIRERARLMGGKCTIRSRPGAGAAIIVELPVVEGSEWD